jgi:putative transposase
MPHASVDHQATLQTIQRALRFRMEPTCEQRARLQRFAGRRAWNWALAQRKQHYAATGKTLSVNEVCTRLTVFKHTEAGAWLKDIDSQLPQQAVRDLDHAFEAFFDKRARFPNFKSPKRDRPRFRIPQRARLDGHQVYVPSTGWVRIRKSRETLGELGSLTCSQAADGHWYCSLTETIIQQRASSAQAQT